MTAAAHPSGAAIPARTPAGVRAALAGQDRTDFERAYRVALDRAGAEYDLAPVHELLESWWRRAVLAGDQVADRRMHAAVDALRAGRPVPSTSWAQVRTDLGL